jgi:hypothetical protein
MSLTMAEHVDGREGENPPPERMASATMKIKPSRVADLLGNTGSGLQSVPYDNNTTVLSVPEPFR